MSTIKAFLIVVCCCCFDIASAQDTDAYWKKWNENYKEWDVSALLKSEKLYADSVEKHPDIAPYYIRNASCRFKGKFLGSTRPVNPDVMVSMTNVLKLTSHNGQQLNQLVENEVLIEAGGEKLWMPIQKKVLEYFKDEVKKGDEVALYCAFLNEHNSQNNLYNSFLISEFVK